MKNQKRWLGLLALALTLAMLSGCSDLLSPDDDSDSDSDDTNGAAATTP